MRTAQQGKSSSKSRRASRMVGGLSSLFPRPSFTTHTHLAPAPCQTQLLAHFAFFPHAGDLTLDAVQKDYKAEDAGKEVSAGKGQYAQ